MKIWIVLYNHRFGTDAWPRVGNERPDPNKEIDALKDWEPDRDESLEVVGPFEPEAWGLL